MSKPKYPGEVIGIASMLGKDAQLNWWHEQVAKLPEPFNPCVPLYGADSGGHKCKECRLFIRRGGHAKIYFKCELRRVTNGPGTDHRANWPACGRFVA